MKTKQFIKKVSRYLVLSKEFEKKESDLFEERAVVGRNSFSKNENSNIAHGYAGLYNHTTGNQGLDIGQLKSKTRSEIILENANLKIESRLRDDEKIKREAQEKADKSDRYDEYLELRDELECHLKNLKK
jgi:hypothetical protein